VVSTAGLVILSRLPADKYVRGLQLIAGDLSRGQVQKIYRTTALESIPVRFGPCMFRPVLSMRLTRFFHFLVPNIGTVAMWLC
jgi:hypothetical protein